MYKNSVIVFSKLIAFVGLYPFAVLSHGGGKHFVWKYYFLPGRKGQQRWFQTLFLDISTRVVGP